MIKKRGFFILGVPFLLLSMLLNFQFPDVQPLGEKLLTKIGIPTHQNMETKTGLHYVGVTSIALLLASLFLFNHSLAKYNGRVIFLAFLTAIFGPSLIINSYQQTFASGIYAISYERDASECRFELNEETNLLYGDCSVYLENKSSKDVQFSLVFIDDIHFKDDIPLQSLMNEAGPYFLTLKGRQSKTFKITANIDVTSLPKYPAGGSSRGFNVIITDGERQRFL
ncbi:hypothetical protein [Ammoniphilus resinae]|uniref:Uncharacterized protein n=1 Tax=Ammoniphilus resinae TaxID=861532 RepID=A0ABS4GP62_9BACL|nr:hypothetical protein [Ammoniphilus resinae]MBP1932011.1 hypothetical protein [Ammoniphilus resinae]